MSVAVLTPSDYERAVDESSRPRLGAASREEKRRYVFGARPRVAQGARSGVSSQPSNDGGRWYLRVIDGGAQTSAEAAPIPPRAVASAVHPVGSAAHTGAGANAASVQAGGSEGVAAQAHPVKVPAQAHPVKAAARAASANSGEAVFTAPMRRLAIALAFAAAIAGGSAIGTLTQGDAHMAGGDYSVSVEAQGK